MVGAGAASGVSGALVQPARKIRRSAPARNLLYVLEEIRTGRREVDFIA